MTLETLADGVEPLHVTAAEPVRHAVEALKSRFAGEQRGDVQVLCIARLRMLDLMVVHWRSGATAATTLMPPPAGILPTSVSSPTEKGLSVRSSYSV